MIYFCQNNHDSCARAHSHWKIVAKATIPSNDLQNRFILIALNSKRAHLPSQKSDIDAYRLIRSTCHSNEIEFTMSIDLGVSFSPSSNSFHIDQMNAGWPDTVDLNELTRTSTIVNVQSCNAFWQCGNNQIINATFHMERCICIEMAR